MDHLRESLLLAALTTISVAISSMLAFTDTTRSFVGPSVATIACSFPIGLAVLKPGFLLSDVMKVIAGCIVGVGLGSFLFYTSGIIAGQTGSRAVVATLFSFPIVCLVTFADPVCKSPLASIFRPDVAIIVMYVMSSFAKETAYVTGLYMLIVYSFASMVTLGVFFFSRLLISTGSTQSRISYALEEFQSSTTHWFEGLSAFMTSSSGDHEQELNDRENKAAEALKTALKAIEQASGDDPLSVLRNKSAACDSLSVTMVVMQSQLHAFRGTIFHDGYSEDSVRAIFSPIRESFDKLRMTTVLALRSSTPEDIRQHALCKIESQALALYNDFASVTSFTASKHHLPETHEEIRLVFAITSIVRFAMLVQHYQQTVKSSTELCSTYESFCYYTRNQFTQLFSREAWARTTNYKHALRAALSQQIVAQVLILLGRSYPTRVTPYLFWALIPVVGGLMSTVGGGLVIGSRNVLGCLLGASLGVITACINAGNREAIYLEMLIIVFVTKFLSRSPALEVAAITFASTWNVLSIPNMHIEQLNVLLNLVGYRLSLTVLGVFSCVILSITLFPSFASSMLKKSTSRTVTTTAGLVAEGIIGVIERIPLKPSKSFDEEKSVCSSSFSPQVTVSLFEGAGSKALKSLKKHTEYIPNAAEESKPELFLIERFGSSPLLAVNLERLIRAEPFIKRLANSACVFSSVAASTRVHENCHSVVFSRTLVDALQRVVDMISGSAAHVATSVMDPKTLTIGGARMESIRLSFSVQSVTDELVANRQHMEKSGILGKADRGGWLLIYVFHFALVEFAAAWDDFLDHIERRRRDSGNSLEESFASPKNNNSSMIHNDPENEIQPIELRNLFN